MFKSKNQEEIVVEILEKAKDAIERGDDLSEVNDGTKFENHVTMVIESIAKDYNVPVEQTGTQSFPDIIIFETFGVEVKYTKEDKWESTGNSIFEGTLREQVTDQIFTFFGRKAGKEIEIRFKKYEDTLSNIKVTHSPRFKINMDIEKEDSIMQTIGISYDEFKGLQPIEKTRKLKEFVKTTLEEDESLWWLDQEETINPKIKEYRKLQPYQRDLILVEGFILFPEIFTSSTTKFLRLSVYLLQEYQIVSSSLRDAFTAGGQRDIIVMGTPFRIPQIYYKLFFYGTDVFCALRNMEVEKLKEHWSELINTNLLKEDNKFEIWKSLIDSLAEDLPDGLDASHIFQESIRFRKEQ